MIIYISGKYSGTTDEITRNIADARRVAIEIWESGNTALCPHLNTAHFEKDCSCSYDQYIKGDLELIMACDAVVMLPNWEESKGARIEKEFAELHSKQVILYEDIHGII